MKVLLAIIALMSSTLLLSACSGTPNTQPSTSVPTTTSGDTQKSTAQYSLSDIAPHNSEQDCWILVDGSVYNVTSFIPQHPGGSETILSVCGKDATTAFQTRNGRGPHPPSAKAELSQFLIGTLKQ